MDKQTHSRLLRKAMADKGLDRGVVADATDVQPRTVTNWRSGSTMPTEKERAALRRLFGPYDEGGELGEVESAVRRSPLHKWRQDAVISTYEKHLWDQGREEVGTG